MSNSNFLNRAEEERLRRQREREAVEQYIRGYQQYPETEEEIGLSESVMADAWGECPWEDDPGS